MESIIYFILAALGLGLLIFIHELGHYIVARRVGMRVEVFSIGFGKPIYSRTRNGVKWQIGWLPLGGYVRFAGMEKEGKVEPSQIKDGFFGKKPIDRIKVALAGPLVNIVFALILFSIIWNFGGREKNFSQFTKRLGWVDQSSELYQNNIRPGDEILSYDGHNIISFRDHYYAPLLAGKDINIQGVRVDYLTQQKVPFDLNVKPYPHPDFFGMDLLTTGVLAPSAYLFYGVYGVPDSGLLIEGSPMKESGIELGDRFFWMDGELLFSLSQMHHFLKEGKALLTVQRGNEILLKRAPRIKLNEFNLQPQHYEELKDWYYEIGKTGPLLELNYIPYDLNLECVVEGFLSFIDLDDEKKAFPSITYSILDTPLEPGDKILAVDGKPINKTYELLKAVQEHRTLLIVKRGPEQQKIEPWKKADLEFDQDIHWEDLNAIIATIGVNTQIKESGEFHLLNSVIPIPLMNFPMGEEKKAEVIEFQQEELIRIEQIQDVEKKEEMLELFREQKKQPILGVQGIRDKPVNYNPSPIELSLNIVKETFRTLSSLFVGDLSPKWLSGPVGIVQVMHHSWSLGILEGIFWLGTISLSLGILNLFPIPVLDGGYIILAIIEMITKRPLKARTLERLIFPFIVFVILIFIFLTYHDLSRLVNQMF
jgi:regulator of sigma E protease